MKHWKQCSLPIYMDTWYCFWLVTNARQRRATTHPWSSGAGRGSTHGLSSALQVMNRLRRQDLNASFYQTVLTDTNTHYNAHALISLLFQLHCPNRHKYTLQCTLQCTMHMLQSLRSFFFWRNSLSEAESFALRANTTVTWDWLRWRGSNPRLGMAVRLAGRKNCGKHVWGLQFHCTGFFIYTTNNHVDLFNDQHIASPAVVGCWSILLRAKIIILAHCRLRATGVTLSWLWAGVRSPLSPLPRRILPAESRHTILALIINNASYSREAISELILKFLW